METAGNKKFELEFQSTGFPNDMATQAEKNTMQFGLKVGKNIAYEWFKKTGGGNCRYFTQWIEFHKRRLYARGEQPIEKYKSAYKVNGDLSHLNMDWSNVAIIPKFVDIIVNGMTDRIFKVSCYAQDPFSIEKKTKYQQMVEADMAAKEFLLQAKQETGIDAFNVPEGDIPESQEELDVHMQIKYKPSIEIAEEMAINNALDANYYDDIKKQYNYDLVVCGMGSVKHEFQPGVGIVVKHVDPASMIWSYTESPTFDDCFYFGEVKRVHISELHKIKPDITDEEIKEIRSANSAWIGYYQGMVPYYNDLFDKDIVTLMYYNYKTTKTTVYKKKFLETGGVKIIEKDETWNPEITEDSRFTKVTKTIDVWYEGVMIPGTSFILKWNQSENMMRPKSASEKALPNYVCVAPRMYKGSIESLTKRLIPLADQVQLTHLKLQQVQQRIVPDGVFLDADGINEVDLGDGGAYSPNDALALYWQTGSVIGRSMTTDGELNHAKMPIQELSKNSGQAKINSLISSYNFYLQQMNDVTGLNKAVDGSTPHPDALVGVQKLAAASSNTATRHILDAGVSLTKRLAEGLSYRIADALEYSDMKEEMIMQLGRHSVGILEEVKDLSLYDFGIYIEVAPDEEQQAKLEQNIQIALDKGDISLEDAIDIREIKNIKLANEYLKLKRKNKQKKDLEMEQAKMQMQTQSNIQSAQAASKARQEEYQVKSNEEIKVEAAKLDFTKQKIEFEASKKAELMGLEFQYNMQLNGMEIDKIKELDNNKEKAKDKRTELQATQQSKLIEQRQNNLPAQDFESSEDNLGGFDLSQFEPR